MNVFRQTYLPNIPQRYSNFGNRKKISIEPPTLYLSPAYNRGYSKPKNNVYQNFMLRNSNKEETTKVNGQSLCISTRENINLKGDGTSYAKNAINNSYARRQRNISQGKIASNDILRSLYKPKNEEKTENRSRTPLPIYNRTSYNNETSGYSNRTRSTMRQKYEQSNIKECPLCHMQIERYKYSFHFNSHPSQILPWLFLGSYKNASDKEDLRTLGITYVLNCAFECMSYYPKTIKYKHLKMFDHPGFNATPYFDKAIDFMDDAKRNNEKILVHCQMGISRSTTCVLAYLIAREDYDVVSGLQFIKKKRKIVMPNYGFLQQLMQFQKKFKD
ncbi:MAG: dual specificity protein phosphatase family protein [archaeon]|nr:dual specificity protein phosphatase family protein [archaeon]